MKNPSLKMDDIVFNETERIIAKININRNRYTLRRRTLSYVCLVTAVCVENTKATIKISDNEMNGFKW